MKKIRIQESFVKKTILIIMGIICLVTIIQGIKKPVITAAYTVGIMQTASHPALDAVREGFIETLKNKMGNTVEFVIQNAQGSVAQAHAVAQQFHANKQYNGFFAIATPAAQAMSAIEKEKPIIIAAVTDPSILGAQTNICGVHDMIDMHKEIDMVHQLLPHAQTIALLYNNGEANSIAQIQIIKKELKELNVDCLELGIVQENDIATVVAMACRKADVLLCPTDNMLASAMDLVASIAHANKKPLIACHNQAVNQGALAARGVDYKAHGKQAGEVAYKILVEGKKPCELPIEPTKSEQIVVNRATLTALGLTIPDALQPYIVLV